MAKIVPGQGVSAISGKAGGTVFATNKGGAYLRRFSKPSNPASEAQVGARETLSAWSAAWRLLEDAQREAWNSWAQSHPIADRFGAAIVLSGHQAYVKINTNSTVYGTGAEFVVPPGDPEFAEIGALEIEAIASANSIDVHLTGSYTGGQKFQFWAAPPVSPGVTNTNSQERFIATVAVPGTGAVTDPSLSITDQYIARFGNLTGLTGKKINAKVYSADKGQLSQPRGVSGIIVAS